jgi:hypothetical protein
MVISSHKYAPAAGQPDLVGIADANLTMNPMNSSNVLIGLSAKTRRRSVISWGGAVSGSGVAAVGGWQDGRGESNLVMVVLHIVEVHVQKLDYRRVVIAVVIAGSHLVSPFTFLMAPMALTNRRYFVRFHGYAMALMALR